MILSDTESFNPCYIGSSIEIAVMGIVIAIGKLHLFLD